MIDLTVYSAFTQAQKHKYGGHKDAVDDLVMLDKVSEDRVLENLRNRYSEDQIYVSRLLLID